MSTRQWRTGTYTVQAKAVRAKAYADPRTVCPCGRTLAQHPPTRSGNPATWSADHVRPGDPTSPLRPMVLGCNASAGAAHGNRMRRGLRTTRDW
jgi:hypothetical protein